MRTELEKLKYIEDYLTGSLPADEVVNFENEVRGNASLAKEVEFQKQIIKRSERIAFKEQLDVLHQRNFSQLTKKWWQQNIYLNSIIILIVSIGAIGPFVIIGDNGYIISKSEMESPYFEKSIEKDVLKLTNKKETTYDFKCDTGVTRFKADSSANSDNLDFAHESLNSNSSSLTLKDRSTEEVSFEKENIGKEKSLMKIEDFLPVFDTIYYSSNDIMRYEYKRSGTRIYLPENLIKGKEGTDEKIPLLYREFRNQAEIAFSGIPMTYVENGNTYEFESGGMFEFLPLNDSLKMNKKAQKEVEIDFVLTSDTIDLDYYEIENGAWRKKAGINETPKSSNKRKKLRIKCSEEKICKFKVTKKTLDEVLSAEFDKRKKQEQEVLEAISNPQTRIPFVYKSVWKFLKKNKEKRKGDKNINGPDDIYGNMKFEILIPNKSLKRSVEVRAHIEEALVYLEEPLRCYEVRELLYSILDKNCNTCRHETHIADSSDLADLDKPLYNLDSLNLEIEKRNDFADEQEQKIAIEALFNEDAQMREYQVNKVGKKVFDNVSKKIANKAWVKLRDVGFVTGNCDNLVGMTRLTSPTIIATKFLNEKKELIEHVKRVSVVPLNFNSASSFPLGSVEVYSTSMRVLLVFSEDGLYYLNNPGLSELSSKIIRTKQLVKLPDSVNSTEGLMAFLNAEKKKLIDR